jgi:TonB family protein
VAARLAEAPPRPEAPGGRTYYWHLRRRMEETWRPGVSREPSIGQTLLATIGMPTARAQEATEVAMGAGAHPGRAGSTMQAADDAHGGNASTRPTVQPFVGIADQAQVNRQVTRAEVLVEQDEDGRVIDIRMARSSRIPSYDRAALTAVREALPLQTPARMPGGRRSRWSFETVASRAPFIPGAGMVFDESSGWFEVVYPGRVFTRSRVWLESAQPL